MGNLSVCALLRNSWQKTKSRVVGLRWCVYIFHSKLEIFQSFPRFSSIMPGKCQIASGFVLSAMIILFYAVLFSYCGLQMKTLIFQWSTHWCRFCVEAEIFPCFCNLFVPLWARFNICVTPHFSHTETFPLPTQCRSLRQSRSQSAETEQTGTSWWIA